MQFSPRSTSFFCNDNKNNTLTWQKGNLETCIRVPIRKYVNAEL